MSEWLQCVGCERRFDASRDALHVRLRRAAVASSAIAMPDREVVRCAARQRGARSTRAASGASAKRCSNIDEREIVTHPEGATRLYERDGLLFKHEGENPTGSFKDRGMTVAMTQAVRLGARAVACASTGNTSASLAAYAAQAGLRAIVFVPAGKVSARQAGADARLRRDRASHVRGDFDAAMHLVREACDAPRHLPRQLDQPVPHRRAEDDRLGAAAGPGVGRARLDRRPRRQPRQHQRVRQGAARGARRRLDRPACRASPSIQASGANPFYPQLPRGLRARAIASTAETVASAIRIGDPVSHDKRRRRHPRHQRRRRAGHRRRVDGRQARHRRMGIGCEPASATTLAGVRKLRAAGVMQRRRTHRLRAHRPRPQGSRRGHAERAGGADRSRSTRRSRRSSKRLECAVWTH